MHNSTRLCRRSDWSEDNWEWISHCFSWPSSLEYSRPSSSQRDRWLVPIKYLHGSFWVRTRSVVKECYCGWAALVHRHHSAGPPPAVGPLPNPSPRPGWRTPQAQSKEPPHQVSNTLKVSPFVISGSSVLRKCVSLCRIFDCVQYDTHISSQFNGNFLFNFEIIFHRKNIGDKHSKRIIVLQIYIILCVFVSLDFYYNWAMI